MLFRSPMLCSDVMHDDHWPLELKPQLVDLCLRLQGRLRLGERELVIKWNAWDLACWPMLLELYPKSRVLCLIRNPKDIMFSHQRVAGRHMAGGQSLLPTELHTQQMENTEPSLDEFRTTVLQHFAQLSAALYQSSRAILLDYHQ